jgi:hypothetical protein
MQMTAQVVSSGMRSGQVAVPVRSVFARCRAQAGDGTGSWPCSRVDRALRGGGPRQGMAWAVDRAVVR